MTVIHDILSLAGESYFKAQLVLIPLYGVYFLFIIKRIKISHQWLIHRALLIASFFLTLFIIIKVGLGIRFEASFSPTTEYTRGAVNHFLGHPGYFSIVHYHSILDTIADKINALLNLPFLKQFIFLGTLGSLVGLSFFIYMFVRQILHERRIQAQSPRIRTFGKVRLIFSKEIQIPFSTGLFYKNIYLPLRLLHNNGSLSPIVTHEIAHIKNGHIFYCLLERVNCVLGWYLPIPYALAQRGVLLREFLCDKIGVKKHSKLVYSKTLLSEAEQYFYNGRYVLANSFLGQSLFNKRIFMLFCKEKPIPGLIAPTLMLFAVLCSLYLLCIVGLNNPQPSHDPREVQSAKKINNENEWVDLLIQEHFNMITKSFGDDYTKESSYKIINDKYSRLGNMFVYRANIQFFLRGSTIERKIRIVIPRIT